MRPRKKNVFPGPTRPRPAPLRWKSRSMPWCAMQCNATRPGSFGFGGDPNGGSGGSPGRRPPGATVCRSSGANLRFPRRALQGWRPRQPPAGQPPARTGSGGTRAAPLFLPGAVRWACERWGPPGTRGRRSCAHQSPPRFALTLRRWIGGRPRAPPPDRPRLCLLFRSRLGPAGRWRGCFVA